MGTPKQDRLQTYQPALARQLCTGVQHTQALAPAPQDKPAASSWEQRKAAQRAALEAKARQKEEAFAAAMQRKREAEAAEREAAFQQVYSEVLGGLEHGTGVLSEVQEVLQYADTAQQARREALHKQWHSAVFEPIQERLQQALCKNSIQQLEQSLQDASAAYVQASNTKRLFNDVILADGYNPLAPRANILRIPTADLADPLLHDLVKTHTEKTLLATGASHSSSSPKRGSFATAGNRSGSLPAAVGASSGGPGSTAGGTCYGLAKATTRSMLETQRWAAGQIHATPYGHCIDDRTAEYIIKPAAPQSLAQKASHVFFDDFTPPA